VGKTNWRGGGGGGGKRVPQLQLINIHVPADILKPVNPELSYLQFRV